ncbi:MAG: BolA family protein [Mariprofundaceae bacterium]|nr:BolA family protein [Mariprofundaceae bacterium]
MQDDDIRQRILAVYPDAEIVINGSDCSFKLSVVSQSFAGMTSLLRQRSIMKLFKTELDDGTWHAITIQTRTPAEQ